MKISEIKPRRGGLCALLADGEEYILNAETVALAGLKKDSEITEKRLKELTDLSNTDRAKSRALWYISRADHSRRALYEKLCRAFPEKAAEAAVFRMEELGLIDDRRYAFRLAEELSRANVSDREILRKLFVKGVPRDIAAEAVGSLSSSPIEQITAVIEKKYKRKLQEENGIQKVIAALARKGFSFSDIKAAIRQYNENIEFGEE